MRRKSGSRAGCLRAAVAEALESRRLLSGVVMGPPSFVGIVTGDVLRVRGGLGDSVASVTRGTVDGVPSLIATLNGVTSSFDEAAVVGIEMIGQMGNDVLTIAADVTKPATLSGGSGHDSMTGGGGDDVLVDSYGADTVNGGGGTNTLDLTGITFDLTITGSSVMQNWSGQTDQIASIQRILSGGGNDEFLINTSYNGITYVDAGGGRDTINYFAYSLSAESTVHGGDGDDTIFMHTPQRVAHYFGDGGNDTFTVQRSSSTAYDFHGGDGLDTVDYRQFTGGFWPVSVTFDDIANDGSASGYGGFYNAPGPDNVHSDVERIMGTTGKDTLIGTDRDETLIGSGGQDYIDGGGGNDWIDGSAPYILLVSPDELIGGPGHDTIVSQNSNDTVVSDADDVIIHSLLTINGTAGDDVIIFEVLDDGTIRQTVNGAVIDRAPGTQVGMKILCGDGNDRVQLDPNLVLSYGITIDGGNGSDTIIGSGGNDSITGGAGDDDLDGGAGGHDGINGDAGNDIMKARGERSVLRDGDGNDTVTGGDGDDDFIVGAGSNQFDGGGGDDSLSYEYITTAISGGNGTITKSTGTDTYQHFETLLGSQGNDTLSIDRSLDGVREVNTFTGSDRLTYKDSRETSPEGKAQLNLGDGLDMLILQSIPAVNVSTRDDAADTIVGDLANDSTSLDSSLDVVLATEPGPAAPPPAISGTTLSISGTAGNDQILIARHPNNPSILRITINGITSETTDSNVTLLRIDGGAGNDRIQLDSIIKATRIYGGAGADTIFGGEGIDRVYGGDGNDWIGGFGDNDILYGEGGADRLFGGEGRDYIVGGAGADVIRGENGVDQILAKAGEDDFRGNVGDLITLV